jgi:hypothetical protein
VPNADSCTAAKVPLFDHLVGAAEQHRRHVERDSWNETIWNM